MCESVWSLNFMALAARVRRVARKVYSKSLGSFAGPAAHPSASLTGFLMFDAGACIAAAHTHHPHFGGCPGSTASHFAYCRGAADQMVGDGAEKVSMPGPMC